MELRAALTKFTINNAGYFNPLCHPNSVAIHVQRMQMLRTWGTHVEITALTAILKIPIFVAIKKNKKEYYWAKYGTNEKQKWVHAAKTISCSLHHMEICRESDHYDVILTAGGSLPTTLPPAATRWYEEMIRYSSFSNLYF